MKISIIHPSRSRPQQAFATHSKWVSLAENFMDIEYILSVDTDDKFDYKKTFWQAQIIRSPNKTAIEAINVAAKKAKGDILIVVSDDTDCFENWDTQLLAALDGKSDFCAKCDDGLQPTLVTMPVIDRIYYNRYGYIYHPEYTHMHADEELTCVAIMTGKYIKLPLLFQHNHYTTGITPFDALNHKNNATWGHGQATLDRHALNNFGIEKPVVERKDIIWR